MLNRIEEGAFNGLQLHTLYVFHLNFFYDLSFANCKYRTVGMKRIAVGFAAINVPPTFKYAFFI